MKPPFEKFRVQSEVTLIVVKVYPHPETEEDAWEVARWVEDAMREKRDREKGE